MRIIFSQELLSSLIADGDKKCLTIQHTMEAAQAAYDEAFGLTMLSGLDLLVHQARHQVRLMAGMDVPAEVLMSAVRAELERRVQA